MKDLENSDQAFGKALWDIYLSGVLPDGTQLAYINAEAAEASSFVIADVDGDGLVYCVTTDEIDPYVDITWIDGDAYES